MKCVIFEGHAIAHPVADRLLCVFRFQLRHICKTNEALAIDFDDTNNCSSHIKFIWQFFQCSLFAYFILYAAYFSMFSVVKSL